MKYNTKIKKPQYQNGFKVKKRKSNKIDPDLINKLKKDSAVKEAAHLLKKGELVALATETVYGLAADALNPAAVKKIFAAKGRPQDNPLIVHIAKKDDLKRLVSRVPERAKTLIDKFWPGPLTIIFSKKESVPKVTSAGLETIAVRMPAHPLILAVIAESGLLLAAPSANTSGFPSPTKAEHVYHDLQGEIPLILDGGPCQFGVESTVIDLRGQIPKVLRPGGISREKISNFLGEEVFLAGTEAEVKMKSKNKRSEKNSAEEEVPVGEEQKKAIAPGMKYRHYAPQQQVFVFNLTDKLSVLQKAIIKAKTKKIALIAARETEIEIPLERKDNIKEYRVFNHDQPQELAQRLFDLLRKIDADSEIEEIYIEELTAVGIGEAVMNRVFKAAAAENNFQPGGGNN